VLLQRSLHLVLDSANVSIQFDVEALYELSHQQRDVVAPLA